MTSQFFEDMYRLSTLVCKGCNGLGECDDCSPHDMGGHSTWTCTDCNGTGYAKGCSPLTVAEKAFSAGWDAGRYSTSVDGDYTPDWEEYRKELTP